MKPTRKEAEAALVYVRLATGLHSREIYQWALEFALEHATLAPAPVPDLDDLAKRVKVLEQKQPYQFHVYGPPPRIVHDPYIWVAPSPWTYSTVYCGNNQMGGTSAKIESES